MNENHLQQIFKNYIDHFEELNGGKKKGPTEWYKWRIANNFKEAMDTALKSDDEIFWKKLYEIKKETEDFIDNYTQPLYGLVRFSEKEPPRGEPQGGRIKSATTYFHAPFPANYLGHE